MAPDPTVQTLTGTADGAPPEVDSEVDNEVGVDEMLIEDELLVEEISIDGMCGVY